MTHLDHRSKKLFCRQGVSEFKRARKKRFDTGILITSRMGDRKIMQTIRITTGPLSRMRKWKQLSNFRWRSTKVIPEEMF